MASSRRAPPSSATEAARKLLRHAFGALRLRSLYAWAVAANLPSIRVLEKCGFRRIGVRRRCHVADDTLCDRLLFDLLPHEAKLHQMLRPHPPVKGGSELQRAGGWF